MALCCQQQCDPTTVRQLRNRQLPSDDDPRIMEALVVSTLEFALHQLINIAFQDPILAEFP